MVSTQATGKSPLAVSPDSITQSAPSITAFATSLASALVGEEGEEGEGRRRGREEVGEGGDGEGEREGRGSVT